ncbi:fumarylacetoacetate hydrolase family protein [Granulibacter bethesdensis]|uniref:Fumarylpyruvate hydrolase n=1 Tax=Granulibacter bethesdensis (strain ATCC BAA-1260 / CGDNIH1) TaxID=391165 RepID=Q0BQK1_GRABC|nr:fumarylacetoacetate hydrolase family protein [Granulibacter bethesdensis]ABI62901.1 Fumarylpyruvate hydrolase [Granulibacter bethesdensis CGDNIH1]AHJ68142.1 Fumarylpyruvate hydrolase [Granulibacter bethesdensis]APH52768.1 Fumarylpyruvate hydrolase [Granulibacter bethesdensis]APH65456.1 Fumarylpyruvate hydrolase [Granulibacter bethesdensis]
MQSVFPPPTPVIVPVTDGRGFPVRRVFCVGRNYAAHAREMGSDPAREPPFFFSKPADAVVPGDADIPYPPATALLHHEVELVVALHSGGRDIPVEAALSHVFGYAVGLDLTRRDLQFAARDAGRPWDMAKGFDHSAPIGPITPVVGGGLPNGESDGDIVLTVNGTERQRGRLSDMIWSVSEIISALSRLVTLAAGDLIMTGTPDGVSALSRGDVLNASVSGLIPLRNRIV